LFIALVWSDPQVGLVLMRGRGAALEPARQLVRWGLKD
jgi:hypothetical protein